MENVPIKFLGETTNGRTVCGYYVPRVNDSGTPATWVDYIFDESGERIAAVSSSIEHLVGAYIGGSDIYNAAGGERVYFKFQIKLTSTGDWTTIAEYDSLKEAAEAFSCYKFKIGLQPQFHFPQKKSSYQPQ